MKYYRWAGLFFSLGGVGGGGSEGRLASAAAAAPRHAHHHLPQRPDIKPHPFNSGHSMPDSPPRDPDRYCFATACSTNSANTTRDDAPNILAAFEECNNGGTVVLDQTYLISSPLDLTFLCHIDVILTGEIHFNDADVYYWAEHSFKYGFQNQSVFWKWGGQDVNIFGDLGRHEAGQRSLIDGHGQVYWEEIQTNKSLLRPMLFAMDGMTNARMSNLRMRNPPHWFNIIANSTDILISNMDLLAASSRNGVEIANSDGWDTYRASRIVIQNSHIINTDDCVSFKPNSTDIVVQNLNCTGSHGISVGSLGQYANKTDIVENLYVYNTTMADASDGARIKVWPGVQTSFQTLLNGGGGLGYVRNVTYDGFEHRGNDHAITITQCYGQSNQTLCREHPANLTIEDVTMRNMWGWTSGEEEEAQAGTLVCSAVDRCSNIRAENISIEVPSGKPPVYECRNLDWDLLEINCTEGDPDEGRDIGQG